MTTEQFVGERYRTTNATHEHQRLVVQDSVTAAFYQHDLRIDTRTQANLQYDAPFPGTLLGHRWIVLETTGLARQRQTVPA